MRGLVSSFFFFNDTATTEIYTLSLHDALPISVSPRRARGRRNGCRLGFLSPGGHCGRRSALCGCRLALPGGSRGAGRARLRAVAAGGGARGPRPLSRRNEEEGGRRRGVVRARPRPRAIWATYRGGRGV